MNLVVSHWSANVAVLAVALAVAVMHVAGLLGLRADARRGGAALAGWLGREVIAFYSGVLLAVLAWSRRSATGPGRSSGSGCSRTSCSACTPRRSSCSGRPGSCCGVVSGAILAPAGHGAGRAAGAQAAQLAGRGHGPLHLVWCGWYVPALYDAGVHHPVVLALQASRRWRRASLLWLQLIGSRPHRPRFGPLYRVFLLAGIVLFGTILGMVLSFGANVLYPVYLGVGHHHLLSVVFDQQAGGSELWVLVLVPYLIAGIALLVRWLNEEESQALSLGLDRMLRPSKSAWPTRTGWR